MLPRRGVEYRLCTFLQEIPFVPTKIWPRALGTIVRLGARATAGRVRTWPTSMCCDLVSGQ